MAFEIIKLTYLQCMQYIAMLILFAFVPIAKTFILFLLKDSAPLCQCCSFLNCFCVSAFDHQRSGVVYNFVLYVCLSVEQ